MPEGAGGDDHGEHLARRHHDRDDHRPESADGVVDEELAGGGRDLVRVRVKVRVRVRVRVRART